MATQQLEDEASGLRLAAGAVHGLNFPLQGTPAAGPEAAPSNPYQGAYNRVPGGMPANLGQKELTTSWVLFGIGFVCCGIVLWPVGIVYANKADQLGNPGAQAAKIANIIMTVLGAIGLVLYLVLVVFVASKGGTGQFPR